MRRTPEAEKFAGGTLAIANHLANFCDNVDIFTLLGEKDSQEAFIEKHLNKKVKRLFHHKKDSPTIVKRRFIEVSRRFSETAQLKKLLEFYIYNDFLLYFCFLLNLNEIFYYHNINLLFFFSYL